MSKLRLIVALCIYLVCSIFTANMPVIFKWKKFIMSMSLNRLPHAGIAIASLVAPPSFAATFSWTPGNTNIVVNTDLLELTVSGITATVQAYTAEINTAGTDAIVIGPWTTKVISSSGSTPGFSVDVRGLGSEQLGLIADPSLISAASGSDYFPGGLSPGFSSRYSTPATAPSAFHFVLFSFDQPVDIPGVTVDDVSNFDRNVWMATGTTAPDFNSGFLSGLTGFTIVNSTDDAGDGPFTHNLGATGISYLLAGAPPLTDLGPLTAGSSQFYIDSFDATALDSDIDGIPDSQDNCTERLNIDQSDTDNDGYGNACDADFNNNGLVDPFDFSALKSFLGQPGHPNEDINGNGVVDPSDFSYMKSVLGQAPGPSCVDLPGGCVF